MHRRPLRRALAAILLVTVGCFTGADAAVPIQPLTSNGRLTSSDVFQIVSRAAAVSLPGQTIVVVDRDGNILAAYGQAPDAASAAVGATDLNGLAHVDPTTGRLAGALVEDTAAKYALIEATRRARTVAFFESREDAFTTRTARFIIQDRFPEPIDNTEAGPLLGVEFSNAAGTDALPVGIGTGLGNGLSGDPGGIPLFKNGVPVGGVGVAGDGKDVAVRYDLVPQPISGLSFDQQTPRFKSDPNGAVYRGVEEQDFDEAVALAAAQGFMAPPQIQATGIFVNGLRFPFTANPPATGGPPPGQQGLTDFTGQILGARAFLSYAPLGKADALVLGAAPSIYPRASIPLTNGGFIAGYVKNNNPAAGGAGFVPGITRTHNQSLIPVQNPDGTGGFIPGDFGFIQGDPSPTDLNSFLTVGDVTQVVSQAATQANVIRAAIRLPNGVPVKVHIAVTDVSGNILGVFRMFDGTNFSFDIAVQKARTAAFFSDDTHAFSARAVGFLSDGEFPPAIQNGITGPLFHLQNDLSLPFNQGMFLPYVTRPDGTVARNRLSNSITIFPGGAPLYKNGRLVGAVGVSGDGVDQDDLISFAGTNGFRADTQIRSNHLSDPQIVPFLQSRISELGIGTLTPLPAGLPHYTFPTISFDQTAVGFLDPDAQNRDGIAAGPNDTILDRINKRLVAKGIQGVRLPFQKFPRNPGL